MSLQGNIEEMGLGAVIQTLSLNTYRGTLRIETEDGGSQFFFISEGTIVLVRQVKKDPVRLGDLLIRAGKIDSDQLDQALTEQKKQRGTQRLGKTLVDLDIIQQEEIEHAVRSKFEEDFLDLFLLDKGRFEFIFGLTPESLFGPEEKLERVTIDSSGIMLEAMRRIDEWEGIVQSLGSLDTIYRNRMDTMGHEIQNQELEGITLPPQARLKLYDLLDGEHSLREVIGVALRDGIATRLETFLFLHQLNKNDLVKPLDFKTLLGDAKRCLSSGDVPGTAKFIRAILGRKDAIDTALIKRYLEFLQKYKRPRLAFDEARRFGAQCLAEGDAEQAIALYELAVNLDRNVEVLDRLFYALLRANKRDRAVEVGLMLRDFLNSDSELSVAVRVCKNLMELDPNNPEVLELSGLILKRQERNEEAIVDLNQALGRIDQDHPRRITIVSALLELEPHRNELRDEQASLELQHAQNQLRREIRRRWLFVLGSLILVIGAWRGYSEYRARVVLVNAETLAAKKPTTLLEVTRLIEKVNEVRSYGYTTVRSRADELREDCDNWWTEIHALNTAQQDTEVKQHTEDVENRKAQEEHARREKALKQALGEYDALVKKGEHEEASKKARAVVTEYGTEFADKLGKLRVFVLVATDPSGCQVFSGAEKMGETPLVVSVPVDGVAKVRLRLSGYRVVEKILEGKAYAKASVSLDPGPTWKIDLGEHPLPPVTWDGGVVLVTPKGHLSSRSFLDGTPSWSLDLLERARGERVTGLIRAGDHAIVTYGHSAVGVELKSGEPSWTKTISEAAPFLAPGSAQIGERHLVMLATADTLYVLDAKTGELAQQPPVTLEGAITHSPVAGGAEPKAFLALADRVVAIELGKASGNDPGIIAWSKDGVIPTGTPIYSRSAEAVLVPTGAKYHSLGETNGDEGGTLSPGFGNLLGAALIRERLSILGKNGFLLTLSAYNGQTLWSGKKVAKKASAGPVALGNDLVVADAVGNLLRFTANGRRQITAPINLGSPVNTLVAVGESVIAVTGAEVYLVELGVKK